MSAEPSLEQRAERLAVADATELAPQGRAWAGDALRRRLLAGADAIAVIATATAVGLVSADLTGLATVVAATGLGFTLARLLRMYDRDHRVLAHGVADELAPLSAWVCGLGVAAVVLAPLAGFRPPSGAALAALIGGLLLATLGLRAGARVLWRQVTSPERVLIVGSGALATAMRRKLEVFEDLHLELVGVVKDDILDGHGHRSPDAFLDALAAQHGSVDRILLASTTAHEGTIAELMPLCRAREIKLGLVPPARGMFGTAVQLDHLGELPIVQYNTWHVSRITQAGKRVLDVAVASVLLVLLLPLLPVVVVAIRMDSPGPAFFRQRRVARGGGVFRMLKLRTMVRDAESRLSEVVVLDDLESPVFKLKQDPRVTRVGRWLRRTSLDELPQLYNVLRGEMSLVGPRPEQVELVDRYPEEVRNVRLAVKPGITGPMQVSGRGALTLEERLAVEREYVENLSVPRDVRIIAQTIAVVVYGRGAY